MSNLLLGKIGTNYEIDINNYNHKKELYIYLKK